MPESLQYTVTYAGTGWIARGPEIEAIGIVDDAPGVEADARATIAQILGVNPDAVEITLERELEGPRNASDVERARQRIADGLVDAFARLDQLCREALELRDGPLLADR